jgi:hypothetical protein
MAEFIILYVEGKKGIDHKKDSVISTGIIKKSKCILLNSSVENCMTYYKSRDNVDSAVIAAVLKISKVCYDTTGMVDIQVDVYMVSDFLEETFTYNEQLLGTITSKISDLDKKLIDLINFGTGILRKDIMQIRKYITDNIREIPMDEDFIKEKESFVEKVMAYIVKNDIEATVIRNKEPIYLIEKDKFNEYFTTIYPENKLIMLKRYMKNQNMLYTSDDTRFEYRRKDNDYYLAVRSDNDRVKELYEALKGSM